jgi:catechol 2,3-dioxygenase-like lactoylglutathione lyase family enzyme
MKRFHVHIGVDDLEAAKRFYSAMFGAKPTVEKPDYAKWMVEEPRINLAVSRRPGNVPGIDHLGIQAETPDELDELNRRLGAASIATLEERGAKCCYAESDKHWAVDPEGVVWEMFQTMGEAATYGADRGRRQVAAVAAVPAAAAATVAAGADAGACRSGCCEDCA